MDNNSTVANLSEKASWLEETIDKLARDFKKKWSRNRLLYVVTSLLIGVAGGLITIWLGLGWGKEIPLVLGSLITLFSIIENIFNFRKSWVERANTWHYILRLQEDYTFYIKGRAASDLEESKLEYFLKELQRILEQDHSNWERARTEIETINKNQ
jgi:hypothetical protein